MPVGISGSRTAAPMRISERSYLQRSDEVLEAAIVQRPPMGIRKDTVEYNASLFATKPNATAEDLLKKMPGVTGRQ